MTFKVVVVFVLCCAVTKVFGEPASYSNVYIRTGSDYFPLDFMKYGDASLAPYAQIAAAPVVSVPAPSAPLAPYAVSSSYSQPLGKIEAYPSANIVPAIVTSKDSPKYGYAYLVSDGSTGDQKVQTEQSDGSVVRGRYSFLQPDGYVRDVQYTADDLSGFKAVVKSFLPYVQKEQSKPAKKAEATPCAKDNAEKPKVDVKKTTETPATTPASKKKNTSELVTLNPDAELIKGKPENRLSLESLSEALMKLKAEVADEQAILVTLVKPEEKPKPEPEEQTTFIPEPEISNAKTEPTPTAMISYDNILKCIQAAIAGSNAPKPTVSPLTYIIVPKNPC